MSQKWDRRFLELAHHVSSWSKDPSTKVGAAIVDSENRVVSLGFNGFPRGVEDLPGRLNEREVKYKMVVHAESNALLFAQRDLKDCTIYIWPFMPCATCAAKIIQTGITRVVAPPTPPELAARWGADLDITKIMFSEAGVALDILKDEP